MFDQSSVKFSIREPKQSVKLTISIKLSGYSCCMQSVVVMKTWIECEFRR